MISAVLIQSGTFALKSKSFISYYYIDTWYNIEKLQLLSNQINIIILIILKSSSHSVVEYRNFYFIVHSNFKSTKHF